MDDENKINKVLPYFALIFGVILLGLSPILISLADAPGMITAFYRMFIPSLFLAIPFLKGLKKHKEKTKKAPQVYLLAIGAGIFFGVDMALWSTGVKIGGPTMVTLMANTAPLWVSLIALLFFKERFSIWFWIGMILAFSGTAIIFGKNLDQDLQFSISILFGLLAGMCYAGFMIIAQKCRTELSTFQFFWIFSFSSSMVLLITNILFQNDFFHYSLSTYILFIFVGIVSQLIAWTVLNYTQGHLNASVISPSLLGQAIIAALIAHFWLNEKLGILEIAGGIIIITGIFLIHRSRNREKK